MIKQTDQKTCSQTQRGSKYRPESHLAQWSGKSYHGDDRHDYVSAGVLKLLGEDALTLMSPLITIIHETGKWPKDFTDVPMTVP